MGKRQIKREDSRIKTRGWRDLFLMLAAVLCAVYLIACTMPRKGRIINNTYVNHVNVSGLDEKEAAARIQQDFEKSYAYQSITVEAGGRKYEVMINKSLKIDAEDAAREACEFAHGNFFTRGFDVLKAAIFKQRFSRNAHIADEAALKQAVEESGLSKVDTTVQTSYKIDGDELVFRKGQAGESVDEQALIGKLKEAVQKENYVLVIESPMTPGQVAATDMNEVYKAVYAKKKDATLDPDKNYEIVPAVKGIDFDVESARAAFDAAGEGDQVVVPLTVDQPDVTTKDLKKHLFKNSLALCRTDLSGSDSRINNIERAADEIDGSVLLAGQSFSFNKTLGKLSDDKGYLEASVYAGGLGETRRGGGVSQVSSALYKSAILSGFKIKERSCHTYAPDFIDRGMDAYAGDDGDDFVFKNNTKYPVKIKAWCDDGQLQIELTGTKTDKKRIEIEAETLEVIYRDVVYRADRTLPAGKSVVIESGLDGYEVQTYRVTYNKKGKQISRKKEARSTYRSIKQVIADGTREAKPKKDSGKDKKDQAEEGEKGTSKKIDTSSE